MDNKFPEYMMKTFRQRRGLDEHDASDDIYINNYSKRKAFHELCEWDGLLGGWDIRLRGWIEELYGVTLD